MSIPRDETFVTPEAVAVEAGFAGLGSRFVGAVVDALLQFAVLLAAGIAAAGMGGDAGLITFSVASFVMLLVYPAALEAATRGKTVGKMAARIRVVAADGSPVRFTAVLVRNILRLVDILPGTYAVGVISILVTKRGQRLGDLAAGTVVVYDAPAAAPEVLELPPDARRAAMARAIDPGTLSREEYRVVRSFLLRRRTLHPDARARLADDLFERLRVRVGAERLESSPEDFLEALVAAYRERWGDA